MLAWLVSFSKAPTLNPDSATNPRFSHLQPSTTSNLQELRLYNCNDLLNADPGLWSLLALCPNMRVLLVEGLNCRIKAHHASELASLAKVWGWEPGWEGTLGWSKSCK